MQLSTADRASYMLYAGHLQNLPWELISDELLAFTVARKPSDHLCSLTTYYIKNHVCQKGASNDSVKTESERMLHEWTSYPDASLWPAVNNTDQVACRSRSLGVHGCVK